MASSYLQVLRTPENKLRQVSLKRNKGPEELVLNIFVTRSSRSLVPCYQKNCTRLKDWPCNVAHASLIQERGSLLYMLLPLSGTQIFPKQYHTTPQRASMQKVMTLVYRPMFLTQLPGQYCRPTKPMTKNAGIVKVLASNAEIVRLRLVWALGVLQGSCKLCAQR